MDFIAKKIVSVSVGAVLPYDNNARVHSEGQVQKLVAAIQEFGFTTPILMKSTGELIAGHGRLEAAKLLGMEKVPAIYMDHLSERQVKALVIADNKIASMSTWDYDKLSIELSELADAEYDIGITGFDEQELDALLKGDAALLPDQDPRPPIPDDPDGVRRTHAGRELPPGDFGDTGVSYKAQHGVIVMCDGEDDQKEIYDRLVGEGYQCKIVVT